MQKTILVGVDDWLRFANDGEFYPDDLPAEWRLGYYANEFETACISLDQTLAGICQDLQWLEDLADGFQLYFAPPTDADESQNTEDAALSGELSHCRQVLIEQGDVPADHFLPSRHFWQPDQIIADASIARLPGDAEILQYRGWIEQFAAQSPHAQLRVWLDASTASAQKLTDCRMLVEMMSY